MTSQAETPLPRKTLWQRWMEWSGSFLILSILVHLILIGLAMLLVVQVVQSRKEKLKFTAAPPSAAGPSEHKVKPSKKTAAAAPAISKRITSTAANASIALPAMEMNATGPDVMASVMSGMGASGLGSGSSGVGGASGAAGMASLPLGGLTAFGFKGKLGGGLVGNFYALDQMADGQDSDILSEPGKVTEEERKEWGRKIHAWLFGFYQNFFKNNCDESILQKYKMGKDSITAFQIRILPVGSHDTPGIFNYTPNEKNKFSLMREGSWVVLYKGTVVAPMSGEFRFTGQGYDLLAVRFDNKLVFATGGGGGGDLDEQKAIFGEEYFSRCKHRDPKLLRDLDSGIWIKVEAGKAYPMEVIISKNPGGFALFSLQIEERSPPKPYPPRTDPLGNPAGHPNQLSYPLFQTRKGVPIPPPHSMMPSLAPDPVVFPGK